MRTIAIVCAVLLYTASSYSTGADGVIAIKSPHAAKETTDRLEAVLKQKGMTIFARVDHAAGAAKIGRPLRPTELLVFGNPQGGTPFIECSQTVGIDLPLKALVWQDESGQVWIGYNDAGYLAQRHGASQCPAVENLKKAVAGLVAEAIRLR
jgi:uncharacterized protein (DUF302 family)